MDPINLLVGINLFVSSAANLSGAKKGLRSTVSSALVRPKSYLQKTPPNIAALVLLLLIAGVFKLGTIEINNQLDHIELRMAGLIVFIVFSWLQVKTFKSLGESYTQEIAILKGHKLVTTGFYKFIRHPQYLFQLLSDIGAAIALLSDIALPLIVFVELPLFILRARAEEKILQNHFNNEFEEYKHKTGFIIPFIGK